MQLLIIVKEIHFQWVPVHVGLEINEKADILAKEGKKKDTNIETLELSDMFILHIYVYMYISSCIYYNHRRLTNILVQSRNMYANIV